METTEIRMKEMNLSDEYNLYSKQSEHRKPADRMLVSFCQLTPK